MTARMLSFSTLHWDGVSLLCLLLLAASPFVLSRIYASYKDSKTQDGTESIDLSSKRPPTLPYYIPLVDHLIQFITDGSTLLSKAR